MSSGQLGDATYVDRTVPIQPRTINDTTNDLRPAL